MKTLVVLILFLHSLTFSFGQTGYIKSMTDSLLYLKSENLDCSADLYWRIVAKGKEAIPFLIDKLNDTTQTNVSHHCKATKLNVGDISYFALQQIAFFPAFHITNLQFDVIYGNGCWSFFDYLFDNANKSGYQDLVRKWYYKNRAKFTIQKIPKRKLTLCQRKFNIDSYLMWTD